MKPECSDALGFFLARRCIGPRSKMKGFARRHRERGGFSRAASDQTPALRHSTSCEVARLWRRAATRSLSNFTIPGHPRGGGDPYPQMSKTVRRNLPTGIPACAGKTLRCAALCRLELLCAWLKVLRTVEPLWVARPNPKSICSCTSGRGPRAHHLRVLCASACKNSSSGLIQPVLASEQGHLSLPGVAG